MSTGEKVSWAVATVGAAFVVAPMVSEDYARALGDAAFALAFFGLVAGLTAFIVGFLYRARDRHRRALAAGRGLLARWTYTDAEWRAFAPGETRRVASEKGTLLALTGAIMLIAVLVTALIELRTALFSGAILAGTWILIWVLVRVQVRRQRARETAPAPEVRIGAHALLIGEELHVWSGWGNRLEACALEEGPPPQLSITYSTPGRGSRPTQTVCVPVPAGRGEELAAVLGKLQESIGKPPGVSR